MLLRGTVYVEAYKNLNFQKPNMSNKMGRIQNPSRRSEDNEHESVIPITTFSGRSNPIYMERNSDMKVVIHHTSR